MQRNNHYPHNSSVHHQNGTTGKRQLQLQGNMQQQGLQKGASSSQQRQVFRQKTSNSIHNDSGYYNTNTNNNNNNSNEGSSNRYNQQQQQQHYNQDVHPSLSLHTSHNISIEDPSFNNKSNGHYTNNESPNNHSLPPPQLHNGTTSRSNQLYQSQPTSSKRGNVIPSSANQGGASTTNSHKRVLSINVKQQQQQQLPHQSQLNQHQLPQITQGNSSVSRKQSRSFDHNNPNKSGTPKVQSPTAAAAGISPTGRRQGVNGATSGGQQLVTRIPQLIPESDLNYSINRSLEKGNPNNSGSLKTRQNTIDLQEHKQKTNASPMVGQMANAAQLRRRSMRINDSLSLNQSGFHESTKERLSGTSVQNQVKQQQQQQTSQSRDSQGKAIETEPSPESDHSSAPYEDSDNSGVSYSPKVSQSAQFPSSQSTVGPPVVFRINRIPASNNHLVNKQNQNGNGQPGRPPKGGAISSQIPEEQLINNNQNMIVQNVQVEMIQIPTSESNFIQPTIQKNFTATKMTPNQIPLETQQQQQQFAASSPLKDTSAFLADEPVSGQQNQNISNNSSSVSENNRVNQSVSPPSEDRYEVIPTRTVSNRIHPSITPSQSPQLNAAAAEQDLKPIKNNSNYENNEKATLNDRIEDQNLEDINETKSDKLRSTGKNNNGTSSPENPTNEHVRQPEATAETNLTFKNTQATNNNNNNNNESHFDYNLDADNLLGTDEHQQSQQEDSNNNQRHPAFTLHEVCAGKSSKTPNTDQQKQRINLCGLVDYGEQLSRLCNLFSQVDSQPQQQQQGMFLETTTFLSVLSEECHAFLEIIRIEKQLENLLTLFKEEKAKKIIKQSMIFERICVVFIAQNLLQKDVFIANFKYLKGILHYAHNNYLSIITILHHKILRKIAINNNNNSRNGSPVKNNSSTSSNSNNQNSSTVLATENSEHQQQLSQQQSQYITKNTQLSADETRFLQLVRDVTNNNQLSTMPTKQRQKHIIQLLNQIRQNNEISISSFKTLSKNDKDFYSYILQFLKNIERTASINLTFTSILSFLSLYLTLKVHQQEIPIFVSLPFLQTSPSPYLPDLPEESNTQSSSSNNHPAAKYTLVLDLDETLIHYSEAYGNTKQFAVRPYVQTFLQQASEFYEIVVFTAGMPDYANWVINTFDTRNFVQHRLYRQHTIQVQNTYIKDLSRIGRDLAKVIIIDNLAENFQLQPDNGIFIREWTGDPTDTALAELLPLLKEIAVKKSPDVRLALKSLKEQIQTNIQNGAEFPHLNLKL